MTTDRALTSPDHRTDLRAPGAEVAINRLAADRAALADADEGGGLNANELLRVLAKWKWLILGLTLASVLLSVLVTLAMTPVYRAVASIEINTGTGGDVTGKQSEVAPRSGDDDQFLRTQYGLLRSRALAERVARQLNLANAPGFVGEGGAAARQRAAASRVAGNLEVTPLPGSSLVEIAYKDTDPERAARIA